MRRHLRVAYGMLNVLVPQIILNGARIIPVRGQVIPARMPQLVGMGDMGDPQPTLVELLVRHVLLPRALPPQIGINSIVAGFGVE
jgi:hypothetical protein